MTRVEIGRGKSAQLAYGLQDVAILPSRRTRDPQDVSLAWRIDAYSFDLPVLASATDSVVSPATAVAIGRLGGLGVLDLDGLWTRYEDPEVLLDEVANLDPDVETRRLQEIYSEPIKDELIVARIQEVRSAGVVTAASLSPREVVAHHEAVLTAGVDLFVIRGSVVSAEHVSSGSTPLNLKEFIYQLDVPVIVGGCGTYQSALHLMRTGAAGVLVGVGAGSTAATRNVLGVAMPMATAIADVSEARRDYLDESGGRYVHVIADGGMRTGGDIARAVACGADAVMIGSPLARAIEAPGRGWHWSPESFHPDVPRGTRVKLGVVGSLREVLVGPTTTSDGSTNLAGALRRVMANSGYSDLKEFQRVEVAVLA